VNEVLVDPERWKETVYEQMSPFGSSTSGNKASRRPNILFHDAILISEPGHIPPLCRKNCIARDVDHEDGYGPLHKQLGFHFHEQNSVYMVPYKNPNNAGYAA